MKQFKFAQFIIASISCLLLLNQSSYASPSSSNYLQDKDFQSFLEHMIKQHHFKRMDLIELFAEVKPQNSIIKAMEKPAEKTKTWAEYRKIFITPKQIEGGLKFWHNHHKTLTKAARIYGVPPEMIVAIIGVETRYGRYKGRHRVIDALATLAFDYPPRASFFRKELEHFLLLSKEENLAVHEVKGSYAGAMGYPQFIPSSYREYAVDFDGDQSIDLIGSPEDAIGSVANYFKRHKWQPKQPVALKVPSQAQGKWSEHANKHLKPKHPLSELTQLGLPLANTIPQSTPVTLIELQGQQGLEYWIGLQNFYVITRYNRSRLYAMAVFELAKELKMARVQ